MDMGCCTAILYKIQTLVDGGARVTLDLSSQDGKLISKLLEKKMLGSELFAVAFAEVDDE